jgi:hypothetical protein
MFCLAAASLFAGCHDLVVRPADSNQHMEDFEAVWNRVNEVYPFLEFKNINWDSLYSGYQARVEAARGDEFYLVLNDLLAELKDGHVYYHTDGGGEVYPYVQPRHIKDRHAYSPFVVRSYFNKKLRVTESRCAEYEILPDSIGYVFLSDFGEDHLSKEFPGILAYLKNTRGLIIDIRQKVGGNTLNVSALVSRFMTESLAWPEIYCLGEPMDIPALQPSESFIYENPVVVIINGSTYSAGELTTEMLKQLPTVTVIGDTTGGGGGTGSGCPSAMSVSEYRLPSGKLISTPTGYIKRYDGQHYEWNGVTPDIYVKQTEEDIRNGRDKQLEYAINIIKSLHLRTRIFMEP